MAQKQGISQKVAVGDPLSPDHVLKPNADGSINILGSVTAGTAFVPTGNATLAVSNVSARVALPSAGPTALITNTGNVPVYVKFGDVTVTAATTDTPIPAQQSIALNIGSNTYIAAITASGTSNITVSTGTGIPSMAGGGSSGGGSTNVTANAASPTWVEGSSTNPLSGDLHGALRVLVDDSTGNPVDWTAPVPVTQSGTWNITNISGTVSLPTGASTEASLVKIPLAQGSTTSGQSGPLIQGAVTTAAPTYTTAQTSPLSLTTGGALRVDVGSSVSNVAQASTTAGQTGPLIQAKTNSTAAGESYTTAQTNPLSLFTNGELRVGGGVSAGTADTGAPVKIGGKYNSALPTLTTGQRGDIQLDSNANLRVNPGINALALSDSFSNTGGFARSDVPGTSLSIMTTPFVYNGSTWDRARSIAGSFGVSTGVAAVELAGATFAYISTATTTQVKSGAGILHKIIVNTLVASATISLIDNTAGSTVNIGLITLPGTITSDVPFTLTYDLGFTTGLRIITSGATDLTVVYR